MLSMQKIPKTIFNPLIEDLNFNKMQAYSAKKKKWKKKSQSSRNNNGTSHLQSLLPKPKKSKILKILKDSKNSRSESMI